MTKLIYRHLYRGLPSALRSSSREHPLSGSDRLGQRFAATAWKSASVMATYIKIVLASERPDVAIWIGDFDNLMADRQCPMVGVASTPGQVGHLPKDATT